MRRVSKVCAVMSESFKLRCLSVRGRPMTSANAKQSKWDAIDGLRLKCLSQEETGVDG